MTCKRKGKKQEKEDDKKEKTCKRKKKRRQRIKKEKLRFVSENKVEDKRSTITKKMNRWIQCSYYQLTSEFTSVTLKTNALSLRGESLSHTYVGESFSIEPYVAFTYGFAFRPNKPTRPLKFNLINFTDRTPPVCTPRAQGRNVPLRCTKRNRKKMK